MLSVLALTDRGAATGEHAGAKSMSGDHLTPMQPYPRELEERREHRGRQLLLRPIRPDDTPRHRQFLSRVSPRDLYTRFFSGVHEVPESELAHFTHIDYGREMAFVAVAADGAEAGDILGVSRACADQDLRAAEFAVLVRSDLKGQGLGRLLMEKLIRYCRERGIAELRGSVLMENAAMLELAHSLGFRLRGTEQNVGEIVLDLRAAQTARDSGTAPVAGGGAPR
jgi:acetyltransferase